MTEPVRYFCPIWEDALSSGECWWMTFNEQTYSSDLLRLFGGENVFAARARRYEQAATYLERAIAFSDERDVDDEQASAPQTLLEATRGAALVVLTVLTRLNISTILSGIRISQFSGAEAGTLLYFVFGLTLLSLSRLMSLQLRWHRQHIRISSRNLVGQWGKYSLLFLLLLGLVVSLLPRAEVFEDGIARIIARVAKEA